MFDPSDDPGWPPLHRSLLGLVLPGVAIRRAGATGHDGLLVLRTLFLSFLSAVLLIGLVTLLIVEGMDGDLAPTTAALLAVVAGVATLAVTRVVDRPLDCSDEQALAASYRTRFFLRLAVAESAALVGFVLSILSADPAPYAVGMVFAFIGLARLAPTARNLRNDQDGLVAVGCGLALVPTLRGLAQR